MAKNNYASRLAEQVNAFATDDRRETSQASNVKHEDPVARENVTYQKSESANTRATDKFLRQTFYMTFEEKAAIDKICEETGIGKSDIIRQILDAGLEAVSPGIFDRTHDMAQALRNSNATRRINDRSLFEKLQAKLG